MKYMSKEKIIEMSFGFFNGIEEHDLKVKVPKHVWKQIRLKNNIK